MLARASKNMGAAVCNGMGNLSSHAPPEHKTLIIITGPSGCGKSTLLEKLFARYPNRFGFSVSHTTRKPRPGEVDGVHYHFVEREEMQKLIGDGMFLEHAEFGSNMYGTSVQAVENVCNSKKICILDIELQGVLQVKKLSSKDLKPVFVYIKPPTFESLEQRLRARQTENTDSLDKRLSQAQKDMKYIAEHPDLFHHTIVNDDLEIANSELNTALKPFIESEQEQN